MNMLAANQGTTRGWCMGYGLGEANVEGEAIQDFCWILTSQ